MSDNADFLIQRLPDEIKALEARKQQLIAEANYVTGQLDAKQQILAALTAPDEPDEEPESSKTPQDAK